MSLTTLYLVRHAHADWSPDDDRPISAAGIETAERVKQILSPFPIAVIYSSPSRRATMTVAPLATSLSMPIRVDSDLRERALPAEPVADFQGLVRESWDSPNARVAGESNIEAQVRGVIAVRRILLQHDGQLGVAATHGNLLTLILNHFDPAIGFEFWRGLSFPDIYRLEFERGALTALQRCWDV